MACISGTTAYILGKLAVMAGGKALGSEISHYGNDLASGNSVPQIFKDFDISPDNVQQIGEIVKEGGEFISLVSGFADKIP